MIAPARRPAPAALAVLAAILALLPCASAGAQRHVAGANRYAIDPAATAITARVGFFGLASKTARFPAVSGGIALDPARPQAIALAIVLDARQLVAGDPVTLARLKGPSFFAVAQYPEIRFAGSRMAVDPGGAARIFGTLTARGITRPVVLSARFTRPPMPGQPITLDAATTIDRRDFGMTAYRLIVGSKVRITIAARLAPLSAAPQS